MQDKDGGKGFRITPAEAIAIRCASPRDWMARFVRSNAEKVHDNYVAKIFADANGEGGGRGVKDSCALAFEMIDDLQIFLLSVDESIVRKARREYESTAQYRGLTCGAGDDGGEDEDEDEDGLSGDEVRDKIIGAIKDAFKDVPDVRVVFVSEIEKGGE